RAAKLAGANAISLINTINSIIGVNLDTFELKPNVGGKGGHGGYAGPAVKPIALHLLSQVAIDPEVNLPISGIGGVSNWRDALEFILLGASNVQVCTAVMHHGFRIVEDMIDGMTNWMKEKGITSLDQIRGKSLPRIDNFGNFDLLNKTIARIDQQKCIHCNLCYVACEDTAHQCIDLTEENGHSKTEVREKDCVGCALCSLVCPVDNCISMIRIDDGSASKTWNQLNEEFRKSGIPMTWEKLAEFQKKHDIVIH
ncbi:MAG: NAD-dependent dihydropyrimidine dehydrogenase subunit PreA, partial [Ignavibacteria bacterium]|nr:NAD-dependent dihydropyrimidine dehydrogenase subunit PreA [Ignavibacteria bacterium]